MRKELAEIVDGKIRLHFHPGQYRAWQSTKRIVCVLAGTQSGKTVYGPHWLHREIKARGPGDYLVVTPSYPLLSKKALPEFLRLFKETLNLGDYNTQQKIFTLSMDGERRLHCAHSPTPTRIYFGHANDPDSLEAATAKAAWLDEAGQNRFRLQSWEAINRRLAVHQGRVLLTTTPYGLGWLKSKLFDPWEQANRNHPEIDVVRFDSTENPAFPPEEFERARASMPLWRFNLFYRAIFGRPAGMIYDCFEAKDHIIPRFKLPDTWPRYLGMDFGPNNTAGVFLAGELMEGTPTGRYYAYREYHPGKRTVDEHVESLLANEPRIPTTIGGAPQENDWRRQFREAGLPILAPEVKDVETGITMTYALIKTGNLILFDDLENLRDELESYSRETDDAGNPTEDIDNQSSYHLADSLRYICTRLGRNIATDLSPAPPSARSAMSAAPPGVFDVEVIPPEQGKGDEITSGGGLRRIFPDW